MKNFFLDAITSSPVSVGEVQVPIHCGTAFVSKLSNANYQILSNGTALDPRLVDQEQILIQGSKGALIKPLAPKNKGAVGKAVEFEYEGDDTGFNRQQCDLYMIVSRELFEFQYWKGSNQLRYHNAEVAIEVARYQVNPMNQITTVLRLVEESAKYWAAVDSGKISMPAINSDGTIITPEIATEYSNNWTLAEEKLSQLAIFASEKNLVNPINEVEYEQKVRAARVTMIASALDLNNTKSLDHMTANQVASIWNELIEMLNSKVSQDTAPVTKGEGDEDLIPKQEKSTNTHGKNLKKKSMESPTLSKESLEPESTHLTNAETTL